MISFLVYAALALAALAYYLVNKLNQEFNYFKNKGISQLPTEFPFGNGRDLITKRRPEGLLFTDFYRKFKEMGVKHGGVYAAKDSILPHRSWVPVDLDLIKTILIKDYQYFAAHDKLSTSKISLFHNNLFFLAGDEWRDMRRKLTPTFTSGKMKMMYDIILEKTNELSDVVGEFCKTGESAEIKSIMARYTTDIIGSCGFGIECSSLKDKNSQFFTLGQLLLSPKGEKEISLFQLFKLVVSGLMLRVMSLYKNKREEVQQIENFYRAIVKDTITMREEGKILRKDFLHLMIQLKNKGVITELTNDNEDVYKKTVKKEVISMEEITGQCVLFIIAGFETSSATMSFAILELTQNQDVQNKLREEVREVLERHNGKMTYDALQEMTYCDNVIHETLRKYPPLTILPRLCTKNYTIPGTDIEIEKGTKVEIPLWALQMDPDYFPEPEKFIPERFNPENKSKIRDMTYMPFGEGPRQCLGLRFGFMQSKAGIAALVKNYRFTLTEKTPYPPEFNAHAPLSAVKGGIWIKAVKVD